MSIKKTIGMNPLEAYLQPTIQEHKKQLPKITEEQQQPKETKERITIHVSSNIIEKVKNAVFWEPGLTISALTEEALSITIKKMEKARGAEYPERKHHNLKGGRPLS